MGKALSSASGGVTLEALRSKYAAVFLGIGR